MRDIDYSKLSESTNLILQRATSLARDARYDEVGTTLLLIAMVQHAKEMIRFVLGQLNVEYSDFCTKLGDQLRTLPRNHTSSPSYSASVVSIVGDAIAHNTQTRQGLVLPENLLLAIVSSRNESSRLFSDFNITKDRLAQCIETYSAGHRANTNRRNDEQQVSLENLERYAKNLRKLADEGGIEPIIGRDQEIRRILQIISRRTKNNPLLLGEPGIGKTAIIEGLAFRLNRGDVPEEMRQLQIYSLDVATLIAGASMQGEFEARLKAIISELKNAPWVILFIDEIHLLLGAGSHGGAMDAANILKPELARSGVKVIGATTFDEYNKFVESDQAFARRFQRVVVEEPTIDDAISIMRGIKSRFEAHHKIKILDEAIVDAVKLSSKYVTDRFLPDKAIDLLDETASRMRIDRASVPAELDSLTRLVRQKEIERQSLVQEGTPTPRLEELIIEISQLKERENELNAKWLNERRQFERLQEYQNTIDRLKANRDHAESIDRYEEVVRIDAAINAITTEQEALIREMSESESPLLKLALDSDDIKESVTRTTGIPVHSLNSDELGRLSNMASVLSESIKGQDQAIASVCNVIKRARMGLGNESSPLGSFLFMGTTGVGKTELAKVLADFLFGSRDMMIRIDMSEYQQEHSTSRLFGAPPGYVGFDQGGQLTEAVRRKPYSVILLDEIEKAHPKICETLLQVLDDGRMTDGKGHIVNFKNTVIIMTSNLGADVISESGNCQDESVRNTLLRLLKQRTSPEFVNRIDDIIIFNPLSDDVLKTIAHKIICDTIGKLQQSEFNILIDEEVPEHIVSGMEVSMGARPIKRLVNHLIVDAIIDKVLSGELTKNHPIKISVLNHTLVFENA